MLKWLYRRRNDAESINRALDDTLWLRRAHSGIWTVQRSSWPSYAAQVEQAITAYEVELAAGTTVLAGDFNCSAQTQDPRQHLTNLERLGRLGLSSAYHAANGILPGLGTSGCSTPRVQGRGPSPTCRG